MPRLPAIAENPWGEVLNDYLSVGHGPDGEHRFDCPTLNELRALNVAHGSQAIVSGYGFAGDGGGGKFYYDENSSLTDDDGTIITPSSGAGRWIRLDRGPADVHWFGATGDGVTDDTTAIAAALSARSTVIIRDGTYVVSAITLPANGRLEGSPNSKLLSLASATGSMVTMAAGARLSGVEIDGTGRTSGYLVSGTSCDGAIMDWCNIHHAPAGAVTFSSSNKLSIKNNSIHDNVGTGLFVSTGSTNSIVGNTCYSCASGLQLNGCLESSIASNSIKDCASACALLTADCSGCSIVGNSFTNTVAGSAVYISGACTNCAITGNTIKTSSGKGISTALAALVDSVISGNTFVTSSSPAIEIYGSNYNTISGNRCSVAYGLGIHIRGGNYNLVTGNMVYRTGTDTASNPATSGGISVTRVDGTYEGLNNSVTNNSVYAFNYSITSNATGNLNAYLLIAENRVSASINAATSTVLLARNNVSTANPNTTVTVTSY